MDIRKKLKKLKKKKELRKSQKLENLGINLALQKTDRWRKQCIDQMAYAVGNFTKNFKCLT